jgi:adenylate kinase family enzyme
LTARSSSVCAILATSKEKILLWSGVLQRTLLPMKRVAVFGNAGGGKSALAKRFAELMRLPTQSTRFSLGPMTTRSRRRSLTNNSHADLLRRDKWIIDGFGSVASAWERFAQADTLIYIDLPLVTHHWWVTKRLIAGLFVAPDGWPENSPVWSSSMSSYRMLSLCHSRLTPKYRQLVAEMAAAKRVHHLRSAAR